MPARGRAPAPRPGRLAGPRARRRDRHRNLRRRRLDRLGAAAADTVLHSGERPRAGAAARALFADDENVHVLEGDWHELLPQAAPFDLVFYDATKQLRPREDGELVAGLLAPGGIAVLDDLTPGFAGPDPVREFWLSRPDLAVTELLTTPESAAILAVRR